MKSENRILIAFILNLAFSAFECIGKDGDTSCQDTADALKGGKRKIQYKSNKDSIFRFHKDLLLT